MDSKPRDSEVRVRGARAWDDSDEELVDTTAPLVLHSKRTERRKRKDKKKQDKILHLLDLPYDIIIEILSACRPSDIISLSACCKSLREFIFEVENIVVQRIIQKRYHCLQKGLRLPVTFDMVPEPMQLLMQDQSRQELSITAKNQFQHVRSPDMRLICTCLTCAFRWNTLCVVIDFAHWQDYLDEGEPITMIARGTRPAWNEELIDKHAYKVSRALRSPLKHARILELHLESTVRSIRRHQENKYNKRKRFKMTEEDARSGTDAFLEAKGPPSLEFPYHRDTYYMLEAYVPNRGWNEERQKWFYLPADQHEKDMEFMQKRAVRRKLQAMETSST